MTIAVIQGSPIFRYNNSYYDFNLVEFDKYLKQCDNLIYLATVKDVDEKKTQSMHKVDTTKVSFRIIKKDRIFDYLFLRKSKRVIIKEAIDKADLVVVKMPSITIGKWAASYLNRIKKPFFVEVCGCAWDSFWYHSYKGKLLAPFNFFITRHIVSRAKHVIYVTNKFLQKRYPNKNHNIGCSNVLLPEFDECVLTKRIERIRNKEDHSALKIGTAGTVNVKYKNQESVIRAISMLKERGIVVDYYLAGGGSSTFLENIAKQYNVQKQVHFLGTIPKSKMYDFYDMLDIYIHPSMAEGLPRVLIEAESRALPALGAKVAGTPELLSDDCVFHKKDVKAICELIISFSKEKMLKQATINFQRAKNYSFDVLNERRRKFYQEVLNNK